MRLIFWNVQHKVRDGLDRQVERVVGARPDVLALAEVTETSAERWTHALTASGLDHHLVSHDPTASRRYFNLLASRWPLMRLEQMEVPFHERVLSAAVDSDRGPFEVHVLHVPPGVSTGIKKVETFEGVYRRLARRSDVPRILCGDFNSPQAETQAGAVITWGWDMRRGRFASGRGERWDSAERSVLEGLTAYGFRDVFRAHNGYDDLGAGKLPSGSWVAKTRGASVPRRFDHVFATDHFVTTDCGYHHPWREDKLSDHSAIEAVLELADAAR